MSNFKIEMKYNITEPDRIDPSTQPSTRDLSYFIETHPNDNIIFLNSVKNLGLWRYSIKTKVCWQTQDC